MVGVKKDISDEKYDDDKREGSMELDTQFTLEFKSPYQKSPLGAATIRTLADSAKQAAIAEDEGTVPIFVGD
jgi:hypothetical protein